MAKSATITIMLDRNMTIMNWHVDNEEKPKIAIDITNEHCELTLTAFLSQVHELAKERSKIAKN